MNPLPITPRTAADHPRSIFVQKLARFFAPTWVRCLTLIVLGVVVRSPALPGELIWDDSFLARDNPFIKSPYLILEAFRHHLLIDSLSAHYRPVQNISYMFDYLVWNNDTYGYHLSNVFWHVASGVLLYFLLRQIIPSLGRRSTEEVPESAAPKNPSNTSLVAFLLALLWVVHPVHSAAVDYISGRADSLAFFFCCGAWLLFLRARASVRTLARCIYGSLAAVSLLLGLCSRESACMWALIFLVHLFFFDRAPTLRAKSLILVLCLSVVAIYAGLRQLPTDRPGAMPTNGWSAPMQSVLMLRALGDYGRLMVFPSNLHMERTVVTPEGVHSHTEWRNAIANEYLTILGLLVAAALIFGACRRGRARPIRAFGAVWFVLTYLPISNLIELNATVAEHWLYLPSVGLLLFLAGCCLELPVRARAYASALACLAIVGLSARSYVRSSDWVNGETFYRRTVEAGGGSVRVVLNLGQIYSTKGDYPRAEKLYRKALELCPTYLVARNNLADTLYHEGRNAEAEQLLREATAAAPEARKDFPRTWVIVVNLASRRIEEKNFPAALEILAQGRRDYPDVWALISQESELLRQTRGADAALPPVQEFARTHWWHLPSHVALGKLLLEKGDNAGAEIAFRAASRLDIHDVSALNMIALLNVSQKHFDEAYRIQRRAIARQPDAPRQYLILSDILEKMGRSEEARAAVAQVSRMQAMASAQTALN